jgi:biotin carboxylase
VKSYLNRPVVLVLRNYLMIRNDHIEAMFQTGLAIHLITDEKSTLDDPRYASVRILPPGASADQLTDEILTALKETGAPFAVTFYEMDIVSVGEANARHGVSWSRPEADRIARDKSLQRAHLLAHGLPTPLSIRIGNDTDVDAAMAQVGTPFVVKPTRGAGSANVELVSDPDRAREVLGEIRDIAHTGAEHFYDSGMPETWALIEEYLPGDEITVDGAVVDGRFVLAGINTKSLPNPPCFEEDLYVMPFGDAAAEATVDGLMQKLVQSLDLQTALVNAELRQGADGAFRFVEFSTRISGGHVYRNIRDVHAVDLVAIFLTAAFGDTEDAMQLATARHPGRVATCIRFIYRTGVIEENSAGDALRDPHFREYYAINGRGDHVWAAPLGFEPIGLLSVRGHYDPATHPAAIIDVALACEAELNLKVLPFD